MSGALTITEEYVPQVVVRCWCGESLVIQRRIGTEEMSDLRHHAYQQIEIHNEETHDRELGVDPTLRGQAQAATNRLPVRAGPGSAH
jgi:hypothetical protein